MAETDWCCAVAARQGQDFKASEVKLLHTMLEQGLTLRQIAPILWELKRCLDGVTRCISQSTLPDANPQ